MGGVVRSAGNLLGGVFGLTPPTSLPLPPPPLAAPPAPPVASAATQGIAAAADAANRAAQARGAPATVATSPQGLTDQATTTRKSLLGS